MQSSFGTKQAEVWVISTYRLEKPRPTRFIWLITLTHSPVTTYHLPLPKGQKHAHKFSPSMAASFTTLVNPPSLLLLIFLSRLPRFLGNQTDIEFLIYFSFFFVSLSDSVCLDLQSNVGSLTGPRNVYQIGTTSPTCNSVRLWRFSSPSSFVSGSFRTSTLISSSSNAYSRRRPGILTSVRASAEVRVFFMCNLCYSPFAYCEKTNKEMWRKETKRIDK
jgi:hypothetical protein